MKKFKIVKSIKITVNGIKGYVSKGANHEIRVTYQESIKNPLRKACARGYSSADEALSEALQFAYCVEKYIEQKRFDSLTACWVDFDESDIRNNHVMNTNGNKNYWDFTQDDIMAKLDARANENIPIGVDNIHIRELTEDEENNRLTIIRLTEIFLSKAQYLVLLI